MNLFFVTLQNQAPGSAVLSALMKRDTLGSPTRMNKASCMYTRLSPKWLTVYYCTTLHKWQWSIESNTTTQKSPQFVISISMLCYKKLPQLFKKMLKFETCRESSEIGLTCWTAWHSEAIVKWAFYDLTNQVKSFHYWDEPCSHYQQKVCFLCK